jgi:hypothetical protein
MWKLLDLDRKEEIIIGLQETSGAQPGVKKVSLESREEEVILELKKDVSGPVSRD